MSVIVIEERRTTVAASQPSGHVHASPTPNAVVRASTTATVVKAGDAAGFVDAGGFVNANPTTATVGGIPAGTTFATPKSMQEMFDKLLYPYIAPTFTSFVITNVPPGGASALEVGDSFGPNLPFTWGTSDPAKIATNSIVIRDVTNGNAILANNQPNDNNQTVVLGAPVVRNNDTSPQVYSIAATDTNVPPGTVTRNLTINWRWKLYYGASEEESLLPAEILALVGATLDAGYARSYAMPAGGYKFIARAHASGGQINSVASGMFSVPMAGAAEGYDQVDGGGFHYKLVNMTNAEGIATDVRLYRTLNSLGGEITLTVT